MCSYDENDDGFVTYEKALLLKAEYEALYGTPCHLVGIGSGHISEITGEELSAQGYFVEKWNFMGRAGNGKIEGVALYFHGPTSGDGVSFKSKGAGKEEKWDTTFKNVSRLDVKTMDSLVLLGCNTGKVSDNPNKSNLATDMAVRMNANYTIASDGKTLTNNLGGTFYINTTLNPKGFKVYKKLNDGSGQVSAARMGAFGYLGLKNLLRAAGKI